MTTPQAQLTFFDLFSGCGGFSLGMERAGFRCLAAIDFNPQAITVFKKNFPHVPQVLERDLTKFAPAQLAKLLDLKTVDVIVGGPPCQGFSRVRRVDGANNGDRFVHDSRRFLYQEFLHYVEFFQPRVFVMENVPGIRWAVNGVFFSLVQRDARAVGYRVHAQEENAWELGVPQKRVRQLIIGTRLDFPDYFLPVLNPAPRAPGNPRLWEAIGDLPPVKAGEGEESCDYDVERRKSHVEQFGRRYLYEVLEAQRARKLTAHRARPHSDRDLRDFQRLKEGQSSALAMRQGVQFEFPYNKNHFKDRYTRQSRWDACSTIVAHICKDGLMFIHPTQNRSLTPREAARVQTFPDWFELPISRMHQFRVIGNAVPPLVSEAVGIAIKTYIQTTMNKTKKSEFKLAPLPRDERQALDWLLSLLDLKDRDLRLVPDTLFKRAWYSIAFLYAGLHPDGALDHGRDISRNAIDHPPLNNVEPRLLKPYYERSGWPKVLAPIAKEAWRRYKTRTLTDDEFYCSEAQMAGMYSRRTELTQEIRCQREQLV